MATKKIRMRPEGTNDYADVLHPETSIDMVVGLGLFGTTVGTNVYTTNVDNILTLYIGLRVTLKFTTANTGASTLNVNSLGAKPIVKAGGSALTSGNLKANGVYTLVYDGTSFQLQGEGGEYGTAQANHVLSPYTIGTENGLIPGTIPSKNAETITPGTTNKVIAAGQFLSGVQTILGDPDITPSNIKKGVNIFGVVGAILAPTAGVQNLLDSINAQPKNETQTPRELVKFVLPMPGTYRITYSQNSGGQGKDPVNTRLYKNGVAFGATRSTSTSTVFTDDITVNAGDVYSIYGWCSYLYTNVYLRNIRVSTSDNLKSELILASS